ncbi:MAG TPA: hypothetical protein VKV37_19620 [Ktedonobacteraceae bacterium]|jgi:hypothetical protein|nr:hypothetical protein [Ktedonobacteraceae bacterium]
MPIATDPLSLLFIACFLFGLLFLAASAFLGHFGHTHGVGHHVAHGALHHTVGSHTVATHTHVSHPGIQPAHAGHISAHHAPAHSEQAAHPAQQAHSTGYAIFGYVNPITISLFLLGFGFFGYVFHNTAALVLPLALVLAALCGIIIAGLVLMLINRLVGDSEGETIQDVSDRTGLLGTVSLAIPERGLGEIIYVSPGGLRKSIPARSVDGRRLERDQEIVVVNYEHGVAEVDTWDHFINDEDESTEGTRPAAPSTDNELATLRALLEKDRRNASEYVTRKDIQKE